MRADLRLPALALLAAAMAFPLAAHYHGGSKAAKPAASAT